MCACPVHVLSRQGAVTDKNKKKKIYVYVYMYIYNIGRGYGPTCMYNLERLDNCDPIKYSSRQMLLVAS